MRRGRPGRGAARRAARSARRARLTRERVCSRGGMRDRFDAHVGSFSRPSPAPRPSPRDVDADTRALRFASLRFDSTPPPHSTSAPRRMYCGVLYPNARRPSDGTVPYCTLRDRLQRWGQSMLYRTVRSVLNRCRHHDHHDGGSPAGRICDICHQTPHPAHAPRAPLHSTAPPSPRVT